MLFSIDWVRVSIRVKPASGRTYPGIRSKRHYFYLPAGGPGFSEEVYLERNLWIAREWIVKHSDLKLAFPDFIDAVQVEAVRVFSRCSQLIAFEGNCSLF